MTDTAIPRWQRAYVIATCAVIAGAFAYAIHDWGQWRRLVYLPVTGELTMSPPPGAIAIDYIGKVAWGVGGAGCGALLGVALCAVIRRRLPDRAVQLLGLWAITAIVLTGGYYTWNLWPW